MWIDSYKVSSTWDWRGSNGQRSGSSRMCTVEAFSHINLRFLFYGNLRTFNLNSWFNMKAISNTSFLVHLIRIIGIQSPRKKSHISSPVICPSSSSLIHSLRKGKVTRQNTQINTTWIMVSVPRHKGIEALKLNGSN